MEDNNKTPDNEEHSLEAPETQLNSQESLDSTTTPQPIISEEPTHTPENEKQNTPPLEQQKKTFAQRIRGVITAVNIYLLLFILLLVVSGIAAFASYRSSKNQAKQSSIFTQAMSAKDLQNLKNNNATVGDSSQVLTVGSNSIFNGQVLVKNDLNVAGTIRVGGTLNLPGITVSGTSNFQNVQIGSNLNVTGDSGVQGTLTVQKNLSVSGSATFGGTISAAALNVGQLTLNNDLQINRHIAVGGPTPRASNGSNIGSGGTVSVGGSDTSGTVNINFGNNPTAGYLANIVFANAFNQTPHVVISPVGSACASIGYYVTRSTTGFSIGANNPSSGTCSFDYVIMG
jgi:cytoskeletal protein CcmA (bactofilin family)